MPAYYNEIDSYCASWLRNLIAAGHIAPGEVDERSIKDVRADDLRGFTQCHFFAGVAGWSLALRLAGWPDDRPVWTGSCPCQPFSAAGAGKAADDERHLWPAWFPLIAERRPAIVFGEQVEAAIGWGWLDAVFADLEAEGYACAPAVLPACGVGAFHIRQRLWFVADAYAPGRSEQPRVELLDGERPAQRNDADGRGADGGLADSARERHARPAEGTEPAGRPVLADGGEPGGRALGNANGIGESSQRGISNGARIERARSSFWSAAEWTTCTDGKARPVEPGTFPLAHGVQRRTSKLRAYGNAIVPQVAAEFIGGVMECRP